MTANQKNWAVLSLLNTVTDKATLADAETLRKAALTLHSWYEHECNGAIQRDEGTGIAYWYNTGKRICKAPDREKGAVARIDETCKRLGLFYYLQTDPRGGVLYVDNKPVPDNNYNRAKFVA